MNASQKYYYWLGYHDGMLSSLKHNINLMKCQIKANTKFKKKRGEK